MKTFTIRNGELTLSYDPEEFSLAVTGYGAQRHWVGTPFLKTIDGEELSFADARCDCFAWSNLLSEGVRAIYDGFRLQGHELPLRAVTFVGFDLESGMLRMEIRLENEVPGTFAYLNWPCPFSFDDQSGKGFTLLPRMQGTLIPARWPKDIKLLDQHFMQRRGTMPVYGQTADGLGVFTILETPNDASFDFIHQAGGDTSVRVLWRPSLGRVGTRRAVVNRFEKDYTYPQMAADYRKYMDERGAVRTMREKIARNPAIGYLEGAAIVHEGIVYDIDPSNVNYDFDNPGSQNHCQSFDRLAERLRNLKAKGLDHVYLHTDGWGAKGYDSMHPDPFPPNEQAGGADGMRRLSETCRELGYVFGIHDQYRDYYFNSPVFTLDNATQRIDGSHQFGWYWCGGSQAMLCPSLALRNVRRNFDRFEKLGIQVGGAYLDVFSIVDLDECFNPDHPITRTETVRERMKSLEFLNARGIIPSSEEVVDCYLEHLPLVHHAPWYTETFDHPSPMVGVAVPFVSLCYHDCVFIPWFGAGSHEKGGWGIPEDHWGYLHLIQNAGIPYVSPEADEEELERVRFARDLQKKLAHERMVDHYYTDAAYRRSVAVYSDGTRIAIDLDRDTYEIAPGKALQD